MSLRGFHIIFITASIILCAFFGFWAFERRYLGTAIISFVLSLGLFIYGIFFLKKVRAS